MTRIKTNKKLLTLLVSSCIFCNSMPCFSKPANENKILKLQPHQPQPQKRLVRILSIDGGGVRGIIPALVLADLEQRLPEGRKIAEYFDVISGTSAGGVIALLLATSNDQGKPKYSASFIAQESYNFSKKAFSRSLWYIMKSGNGWLNAKYDEKAFQEQLKIYFDNEQLKNTVTNVIIPTYEIEQGKTFFFKSARAKNEAPQNCHLRDLAYATSAAPTYFRPARLIDSTGERTLVLVDGGVAANNPTLAAAVHAIELYGIDIELLVVSLGTGTRYGAQKKKITYEDLKTSGLFAWATRIIPILMHTSDSIVDYEMYYTLNFHNPQYYFRIQTILEPENSDLDNINESNFEALKNLALDLIKQHDKDLDYLAKVLVDDKYIIHPEERKRASYE